MIKSFFKLAILSSLALSACTSEPDKLVTRSVEQRGNKCIVQQLPASYDKDNGENRFNYYRVIIESKAKIIDSSHVNYVNFGMESSIWKVAAADTLYPAFVHRIANGKKDNYEYIVSFEKVKNNNFEIVINDQAFEMGLVSIKF
jgi:hypothetical protein